MHVLPLPRYLLDTNSVSVTILTRRDGFCPNSLIKKYFHFFLIIVINIVCTDNNARIGNY